VVFALIKASNTLFELEERLVDLLSIDLSLFFHVHVIGTSLITGQINEIYFSEAFFTVLE
jgi:hypothetical protein